MNDKESVVKEVPNLVEENLKEFKKIFPGAFSEGKIDLEKLRSLLGDIVESSQERYSFNWAGKRQAIHLLQTPSCSTLLPYRNESINFDETENVFIEGDNLEVLKLLYKSYFGRIKMIYIDPPYNTGSDFVYQDNYIDPIDTYLRLTGQKDGEGNLIISNPETNGRYHSSWLSMIYPRLFFARQLLKDDGVIFISIDDHEVYNLRILMNEIFGEENFIAELVWEGTLKNDSKFISISHDYIICYAKDKELLKANDTTWRSRKEGIEKIYAKVDDLKKEHGENYELISEDLRSWYTQLSKNDPAWYHKHYNKVDKKGVYFPSDISWPGGGGPVYEVIHPIANKPVKVPARGWVYPNPERMKKAIEADKVDFGPDERTVPTLKRYLHETEGQVLPSVFYKDRRAAMKRLRNLFGADIFENPKDESVISKLIEATTKENDIVLDFFAGSCTTAHSVIELNLKDAGKRRFIMVQIPEPLPKKCTLPDGISLNTIADIGKERIRRVINILQKNNKNESSNRGTSDTYKNMGVKIFKLSTSNFRSWNTSNAIAAEEYSVQLSLFIDPLIDGWAEQNVIFEIALKEGFDLNCTMRPVEGITSNKITQVIDRERSQFFYICLDDKISFESLLALNLNKNDLFICRDIALNDTESANLGLQCRLKTI